MLSFAVIFLLPTDFFSFLRLLFFLLVFLVFFLAP